MLVLSRKPNEEIILTCECGCTTTISAVRVTPNSVRLGIEAPRETNIVRAELREEPQGIAEVAHAS